MSTNDYYLKVASYIYLQVIKPAASSLWQNGCKTRLPQKNICSGVHSYYNSSFKIHKWKLKIKAIYRVVYSTAQVFLHSRSQRQPPEVFSKKKTCSLKLNKFYRKAPVLESHFNEVSGLQPWNFIKKRLRNKQAFSSEYCKIFKNTYFKEHLRTTSFDVVAASVWCFDIVFWMIPVLGTCS